MMIDDTTSSEGGERVVDTEHSLFYRFLSTAILADLATFRAKSSTIFVVQQQCSASCEQRAASSRLLVCIAQIHLARSESGILGSSQSVSFKSLLVITLIITTYCVCSVLIIH